MILTMAIGYQLLNKFVGESERAVREIFHKARAASPSIVFFVSLSSYSFWIPVHVVLQDEIDALGTSRSSEESVNERHQGVLTTLLNEMDGIQELVGVTIVAATNRPEVIVRISLKPVHCFLLR